MQVTACLIIIGNEILSGRTQDKNLAWIARELNEAGITLSEVRVIPDVEETIVNTVNSCRKNFDHIFTTGGIGPTHDDITSAAIARAFGVALERNKQAQAILEKHYSKDQLNDARLKMADMPAGAALIANPVSAAPGFSLENVHVMAGVPAIMQAMFAGLKGNLRGGARMLSKTVSAYITEGVIAAELTAIAKRYPQVEVGSYPFIRNQRLGVSLVTRTTDATQLEACYRELKQMLLGFTSEVVEEDLAS